MKNLQDILYKVSLQMVVGGTDIEINRLTFDSRDVDANTLFVAVKGTRVDGHDYIQEAIANGATAIICEQIPEVTAESVSYVKVNDSARALGVVASNFYDNPSDDLQLIGITGTNGKTTTVTLLHQLFMKMGYNTGMLTTITNKINDQEIAATHTTPDAIRLNQLLRQMVQEGCTHCFMEASSHALVQERLAGQRFSGAVFTNISHDHLDYHENFTNYINAKKKLFDELPAGAFALVNDDDKRGRIMLQNTKAARKTFALKKPADFKGKVLANTLHGLEMEIDGEWAAPRQVWFRLIGDFNAYNILAGYGVALILGEDPDEVLMRLSQIQPARGRFENVRSASGITAIVDYAHTPDALENLLKTIQGLRTKNEKVITVVGCGGNRDKQKRPLMAAVSCKYSDLVILTSDNPRYEDPEAIIQEMYEGVSPSNYKKVMAVTNRREAIKTACTLANKKDIILVAGKGHETYQEIKGERLDFDDKQVLDEMLGAISK